MHPSAECLRTSTPVVGVAAMSASNTLATPRGGCLDVVAAAIFAAVVYGCCALCYNQRHGTPLRTKNRPETAVSPTTRRGGGVERGRQALCFRTLLTTAGGAIACQSWSPRCSTTPLPPW